ncbi:hypothetical protein ACLM5J_11990 [Nocardioides sp. Bht2]|uniref:hypothetical protein n=1 Tax=Nocardioides sp. Bht2 TaxID=3392297 RepID=UPI0039B45AF6
MNPVAGLSVARIVIGLVALASPALSAKLFRLDASSNPQLGYMSRMFGSREVALGVITLAAPARLRTPIVVGGIAIDAADAAAGALAGRDGSVAKSTSAFLVGPAILAIVAGIIGLRR